MTPARRGATRDKCFVGRHEGELGGISPLAARRFGEYALEVLERDGAIDVLALDEMLPTGGRSAHDLGFWAKRLQPSRGHAEELADQVASVYRDPTELDEQMARWFLS